MLLLLALGVELLQVSPKIAALLLILDARKHHFCTGNLRPRVGDVLLERRLVPRDARVLVGLGVIVAFDRAGLATVEPVEQRADFVLGVRPDRMAGQALLER